MLRHQPQQRRGAHRFEFLTSAPHRTGPDTIFSFDHGTASLHCDAFRAGGGGAEPPFFFFFFWGRPPPPPPPPPPPSNKTIDNLLRLPLLIVDPGAIAPDFRFLLRLPDGARNARSVLQALKAHGRPA